MDGRDGDQLTSVAQGSCGSVLSAIGLNLIASVIFAVVFSLINSRAQERALVDNIE